MEVFCWSDLSLKKIAYSLISTYKIWYDTLKRVLNRLKVSSIERQISDGSG